MINFIRRIFNPYHIDDDDPFAPRLNPMVLEIKMDTPHYLSYRIEFPHYGMKHRNGRSSLEIGYPDTVTFYSSDEAVLEIMNRLSGKFVRLYDYRPVKDREMFSSKYRIISIRETTAPVLPKYEYVFEKY